MAWRLVKQPNGKLARFSSIVDNFTHYDMTEDRAEELAIYEWNIGAKTAKEKIQAAIDDIKPGTFNTKGSGLSRWNDALDTIKMIHGPKMLKEMRELICDN